MVRSERIHDDQNDRGRIPDAIPPGRRFTSATARHRYKKRCAHTDTAKRYDVCVDSLPDTHLLTCGSFCSFP